MMILEKLDPTTNEWLTADKYCSSNIDHILSDNVIVSAARTTGELTVPNESQ